VTSASARALLAGLVDYAGLFPPAALSLDAAVAEYARWRRSPEAWMLGRFVAPAARLVELGRAADAAVPGPGAGEPWRVSALVGADVHGDAARVSSWNVSHSGRATVDSIEVKAASPQEAETALDALPLAVAAFVELPLDADLRGLLTTLKRRGARAKVRTGGVVPEAIPEPADVARFLVACAAESVPFKATAGLHHPVRSDQALTYEGSSPRATMHGFLNVFGAAALAREGLTLDEIEAVLREDDPAAFRLDDAGLDWRGLRVTTDALAAARRDFAFSFGSCSFAEPVADLRALGVLACLPLRLAL
jgi:hypothetical protein